MDDDLCWQIEQERRVLLLLARNQFNQEQIGAASRHVRRLGRLLKQQDAAAGARASPAAAKTSAQVPTTM